MPRRSKIWLVLIALFILVNIGGTVMAAAAGEVLHTCAHVALILVGEWAGWRIFKRSRVPQY